MIVLQVVEEEGAAASPHFQYLLSHRRLALGCTLRCNVANAVL